MTVQVNRPLKQKITNKIKANGPISFADFMQTALYEEQSGYYVNGGNIFGSKGDFITAPVLSKLFFPQVIANYIASDLSKNNSILEIGAGNATLAANLIKSLAANGKAIDHYYIYDVSPSLRRHQRAELQKLIPEQVHTVKWLSELPDSFSGVILANELLDAMPVHRVIFTNGNLQEQKVGLVNNELDWQISTLASELSKFIDHYDINIPKIDNYQTEVNLALPAYIEALANKLKTGKVLLIDYGYLSHEYYHPQRTTGTLQCHYKHQAHSNPFINLGEQDITAHVDFSLVMQCGKQNGFEITEYGTQAQFLLNNGLCELAEQKYQTASIQEQMQLSQEIRTLTNPEKMGETFKICLLTK